MFNLMSKTNETRHIKWHETCKYKCRLDTSVSDPCSKLCVPDVVKNINVKVFNIMPRINETGHIKWYETCKCKCRLDAIVCNNKQCLNNYKCRCEYKDLIDNGRCDKGFIWNPSNCECQSDKLCDFGGYLDYKNCKCRKKLVDRSAEECSENIDGNKVVYNGTFNDYGKICNSCTVYIVLLVIFFIMSISISSIFIYFHRYIKRIYIETTIYWKYKWEVSN